MISKRLRFIKNGSTKDMNFSNGSIVSMEDINFSKIPTKYMLHETRVC